MPGAAGNVDEGRDGLGRRQRTRPVSTGKRVTATERDLLWFRMLARHGPLPTSFLLRFAKGLGQSEKRARERLTDLFNEDNTPHGGTYLTRPPQQFRTLDSRYNQLVHDVTPAARQALQDAGIAEERPTVSAGPWLHRFMVSAVTASVDLATRDRADLAFIPETDILTRADTDLRHKVTTTDPSTGRSLTKTLIPDAIFGLQYRTKYGDRFRFFLVEADRATEPATSRNWNRKSWLRSVLQYETYIGDGAYRDHLKLTAPLLVLNVCSDVARLEKMREVVAERHPRGNPYLLFQNWADFGPVFRPPEPNDGLLTAPWLRVGRPAFQIDQA